LRRWRASTSASTSSYANPRCGRALTYGMAVGTKDVVMAILQIAGGRPRRAAQLPRGQPLGTISSRLRARMPDVPLGRHRHSHSNGAVHAPSVAPSVEHQSDFHAGEFTVSSACHSPPFQLRDPDPRRPGARRALRGYLTARQRITTAGWAGG